ncbi:MAG: nucleotide exchange factor GrpE [Clostridia bacterium]|nr:nucleotide exchange factor GrpE [Clostridia bacterium]
MSKEKKNRPGTEERSAAETAEETLKEAIEAAEKDTETKQPEETAPENPLEKQLEEASAKAAEYLAMAQRIQADFENYRKRNEMIRADSYAEGRKDVATVMLPVLDNLERAVDAAEASQDEALKNGVELVLKQMTDVYQKLEVTVIDRKGEKFDPNLENAVLQGAEDEGEPGTVCQVLQKGYRMGDKVLRHAMVKVVPE